MSKLIGLFLFGPFILLIGLITRYFPPKKPNDLYGYRTKRSMKNQDTWDFANRYSSYSFIISGLAMTLVSILTQNMNEEDFALINIISLMVGLGISIFMTERVLKQNYDENGNRK